ncbi:MAG: glycerol acyltransferase, partial [Bacteroidales bacterium]|nr:glycerol acyltransferase [Bacteroidales bacterium]
MQNRLINVDEILATKFPKKKFSPWVVKLIKNILHVDELNEIIRYADKESYGFCEQVLEYLDIKIELEGLENVPADGTLYTFASNHPLGGI